MTDVFPLRAVNDFWLIGMTNLCHAYIHLAVLATAHVCATGIVLFSTSHQPNGAETIGFCPCEAHGPWGEKAVAPEIFAI